MSNVITVIAVQMDTQKCVFIDNTAKRHTVFQTDPALAKLLAELMPLLVKDQEEHQRTGKPQKGVKIDLATYSMYADFEEKTGGLVKFFRAAKAKVASFFEVFTTPEAVSDQEIEKALDAETEIAVETVVTEVMVDPGVQEPAPAPTRPRYEDMKQDLKPITTDGPLPEDETLVAVINGVVIPGIDALKPYIVHALKNNSVKSVTAFLERIARVIDSRGHSIPDLMQFIEKGDLPLAEDGSIIAYKILRRTDRHGKYAYVDCHSGKVHQRIGTWVRVPERLVDPNRHQDCSFGLHVARRGYIGNFSGDVCCLIKMAPEDVIAVPHQDANKVRTASYFIIGELSSHVYNVLRANKGMTHDPEAAAMLQKAISGDHISVLEEVWVEGQKGTNIVVRNEVDKATAKQEIKKDEAKVVKATEDASEVLSDVMEIKAAAIDPREMNKKIREEVTKVQAKAALSLPERFNLAWKQKDKKEAEELLALKKAKKKSWIALGLPADAGEKLQDVVSGFAAEISDPKPKAEPKKKATSIKEEAEARSAKGQPKSNSEKKTTKVTFKKTEKGFTPFDENGKEIPLPEKPVKGEKTKLVKPAPAPVPATVVKADKLSASQQAANLYLDNKWADLHAFKKAKKKSWDVLGFTAKEIADIEKHKP